MKTIITIWNTSNKGKSQTILELAKLLIKKNPSYKLIFCSQEIDILTLDFRLIIEINGIKIAMESKGDPKTNNKVRIEEILVKYNPNILITTSRTRGETVDIIDELADKYDYDTIWTSTYQVIENNKFYNQLKAKHLLELIDEIL